MGNRTAKAVCNKLAWVADLRAIEIKSMQYKTTYSVLARLESNMYHTENYHSTTNDELASFYNEFYLDNNFQRRMKLYAETIGKYPEMKPRIEELAEIPLKYKNYYNVLGEGELKALSYKEADIIRQIRWLQSEDNIRKCLREHVKSGENYSNAEAKELIRRVYEELGLPQTPKASSLPLLIDAEEVRFTDVNGDRQRGYKIL